MTLAAMRRNELNMELCFGVDDDALVTYTQGLVECHAYSKDKKQFAVAVTQGIIFFGYIPEFSGLDLDRRPTFDLDQTHFRGARRWKFLAIHESPLTLAALDDKGILEIWQYPKDEWVQQLVQQRAPVYMDHQHHMSLAWSEDGTLLHLTDSARRQFYFQRRGRLRPAWCQSAQQIVPRT